MAHKSRRKHLKHVAAHEPHIRAHAEPQAEMKSVRAMASDKAREIAGEVRHLAAAKVQAARSRVSDKVASVKHRAESIVERAKGGLSSFLHKGDHEPLE